MRKNIRFHLPYLVILFIFWLSYYHNVFFSNEVLFSGDNFSVNIPFINFLVDSIKAGEFPLWNPYILSGQPFLVGSNIFAFPTLILFFIIPDYLAMTYSMVLITLLSGIGMYFLSFSLTKNKLGSLFSSIVYIFSGMFALAHGSSVALISYMYLPLLVLFLIKAIEEKKVIFSVIGGILLTLFYLAGHPLLLYLSFGFSVIFVLIYLKSPFIQKAKYIFITLFTFFLLSFPLLLSQFEFARLSTRPLNDFSYSLSYSLRIRDLFTMVIPYIYGVPEIELSGSSGNFLYIGLLPLVLTLYSFKEKSRLGLVLGVGVLISGILSLGGNTPLYKLVLLIPGFSLFRQPGYFFTITVFSLSLLSGMGLGRFLLNYQNIREGVIKFLTVPKRVLIILVLIWLVGVYLYISNWEVYTWYRFVENISGRAEKLRLLVLIVLENVIFSFIILGVFLNQIRRIGKVAVISVCIFILTFLDLYFLNKSELFYITTDVYEKNLGNVKLPQYLKDPNIRIASFQSYKYPSWDNFNPKSHILTKLSTSNLLLYPNRNIKNKVYSIEGFNPLVTNNIVSHMVVDKRLRLIGLTGDDIPADSTLLGSVGVSYILSDKEIDDENLVLVDTLSDSINVYKNLNAKPRAYLVDSKGNQICCAKIVESKANSVTVEVEANEEGSLILLDTYYPGWKAYIDGKEVEIKPFKDTFRMVEFNNGLHEIEFEY